MHPAHESVRWRLLSSARFAGQPQSGDQRSTRGAPERDARLMAAKTDALRRLVRVTLLVLIVVVSQMLGLSAPAFSIANGPTTSVSGSEHLCSSRQLKVSVTEGIPGMGQFSWVILVSNAGPTVCPLTGYPDVDLLNSHGVRTKEAAQTPTGFSGGPPPGAPLPSINLHRGEVASALMEGTDIPPGNATTCPSYPSYTVTLPGLGTTVTIDQQIGSCSGLSVHPFVIGFNGTIPTGEVVGLAPPCARPLTVTHASIGPLVQVDAWSGSDLAASVGIAPSRTRTTTYRLIVKPGRYRIHSEQDRSSVPVVVHAGRVVQLGLYGMCTQVTTTSTVPGISGTTSTVPSVRPSKSTGTR